MKKTAIGFFIVTLLLITIFHLFKIDKAFSSYGSIIFSENFNPGFGNNWTTRHISGPDTSYNWNIVSGMYGMKVNTAGQAGNSVSGEENWTDYAYELDMKGFSGEDKNIPFRYTKSLISPTLDKYYEIHVNNSGVYLGKANGGLVNPPTGYYYFSNNVIYRWRIELVGNNIKVYVKNISDVNYTKLLDFTDNNSPYLTGSIGLRVGTGGATTEVYFDNIKVYDLRPDPTPTPTLTPDPTPNPTLEPTPTSTPEPTLTPTPTPIPPTPTPIPPTPTPTINVPYFSQRDANWKDDQYDFLHRTIEAVGCALTSTAMVLRHHGLDKLPLNGSLVDLNPGTLNQWLNLPENTDGWWRQGSMSWGAITRLAKILHDNYSASYPKLEYTALNSDSPDIATAININRDPLILKYQEPSSPSSNHFVVGYGLEATPTEINYFIVDPWSIGHDILAVPPVNLYRAGYFYKTNSDLSYIYINADQNLDLKLTNSQSEPVGDIELELPLSDQLDPQNLSGQPFWNLSLKYPPHDKYRLTLSAPSPDWYRFEVYVYNHEGEVQVFKLSPYLLSGQTLTFTLTYKPDQSSPFAALTPQRSYIRLRDLIIEVAKMGWLDYKTSNQFLRHLSVSESVYAKNPADGLEVLNSLSTQFQNAGRQTKLREPGFGLLTEEIKSLADSLMLH